MAEWQSYYTSVGGRYTGRIPYYDYNENITGIWSGPQGTDPTKFFYNINGRIRKDQLDVAMLDRAWVITADQYPVDYYIMESDNDGVKTYFRVSGDLSGGNYSIEFSYASDPEGPWTRMLGPGIPVVGTSRAYLVVRHVDNIDYIGIMTAEPYTLSGVDYYTEVGYLMSVSLWEEWAGTITTTEEFSPEYGDASAPGGYDGGTFDDSSDTIGVPTMPSIGVSSIGFVNVYNPSTGALASLGEDLFPDFTPINPYSPTGDTVIDAITDVAEALANIAQNIPNAIEMFNNSQLINYIIDCHIIPVTPTISGSQAIKIGYRTMSQTAPKVTSDYVDCDCGSLNIGEYYRNFIDYGPYTQAKLFLPFVGFVPIEPELFQSGVLKVIYRFNVIDGSFMAFVLSTSSKSRLSNTVIGQWGGNACVHIPITGVNYSNMVSGIAAGASAVVAEIGKGSLLGTADAALNTAAAAPALQSSNGYNATTSFLSVRTPYLMIERSVSHYSKDYGHEQGYPSEITADWSKLSGYTESDAIHLKGLGATEEETKEIASLLAAGVIL